MTRSSTDPYHRRYCRDLLRGLRDLRVRPGCCGWLFTSPDHPITRSSNRADPARAAGAAHNGSTIPRSVPVGRAVPNQRSVHVDVIEDSRTKEIKPGIGPLVKHNLNPLDLRVRRNPRSRQFADAPAHAYPGIAG